MQDRDAGDSRLTFERLITEIATDFLGIGPRDLEADVEGALGRIREFFDADLCGLFSLQADFGQLILTHMSSSDRIPVLPKKIDYAPRSPWRLTRLLKGETLLISSLAELPAEASIDRQSSESLGIQAYLSFPVVVEGMTRYVLHLAFTRPAPADLKSFTSRLRVLAEVLVAVLERNSEGRAREEAEVRLSLAAGLAGAGLWDLDMSNGQFWVTPRTRELYEFGPEEAVTLETVLNRVHPEDVPGLRRVTEQAMQSGEPLQTEYRLVLSGGRTRWIAANGARSPNWFKGGNHFLGASVDITSKKEAEEALTKSHEELRRLKERIEQEANYLRREVELSQSHKEITGRSDPIKAVLQQIEQVAPTDSTVLITGETGTGKELVARAIHGLSRRKEKLMVKVDCASLPSALIESELFGRERGAYTGALTRQVGRFQLADGGTIFLDEIGELPRETQAKLLRVLQDGTFEALGSPRTIHVDARVIAATNRDLAREVREGRFREDLYYRLNVFPIRVPPLRDRREDIPALVWSFVELFSSEMRKDILRIPKETMDALVRYDWPGNIRELRNLIEQAFIISGGDILDIRLPEQLRSTISPSPLALKDLERNHIWQVLDQTRWRIKGPGGAAEILSINPSSLYSRMKKLGIPTRRTKDDITS